VADRPGNSPSRSRARFMVSIPARLEVLKGIRERLGLESEEARTAALRLADVLQHEAEPLRLKRVLGCARRLERARLKELAGALEALERALGDLLSQTLVLDVIVVEDEATTALVVREGLEARGFRVRVAESGKEALRMATDYPPDAFVLDLVLPDMDGRSLLAELRQSPLTVDSAILILSASDGPIPRAECLAYGADVFLSKPTDPPLLAQALEDLLGNGTTPQPAAPPAAPGLQAIQAAFRAIRRERGQEEGIVLALLDLARASDAVADWHGPTGGHGLMEELRERLRPILRPDEMVGRWSVDQLLFLSPGRSAAEVAALIQEAVASGSRVGQALRVGIREAGPDEDWVDVVSRASALMAPVGEMVEPPPTPTGRLELPTVVVAEDDPITATLVSHRLKKSGFRVLHRGDGSEALHLIFDQLPAVVILDIRMPGMDGFEVLSRMRRDPRTERTPALILTSLGRDADLRRAFELGADDYLTKPFSPAELLARVLRLARSR
jgi:two-component system, cell cycle response regulator